MNNAETIAQIVILPVFMGVVGWIFKLYWDWKKAREKSSIYNHLMDRFTDIKELNNFLQTESGSNFLKSLTINGGASKNRFVSDISRGIMVICPGAAILVLGWIFPEDSRHFFSSGVIVLSIGIGFLLSAAFNYMMAGKEDSGSH